jgi:hypothetical protein
VSRRATIAFWLVLATILAAGLLWARLTDTTCGCVKFATTTLAR